MFNGHGDVVQTVSEAGVVENNYDYGIFGEPILTIEQYPCAIRYAGEFYDSETGLYYLRARYYDSYIARFISEDTYAGNPNDPLSLNLYTYAYNNPIMYIDPSGHTVIKNGASGDGVVAIQEMLQKLGYNVGKADGQYGSKTEAAIKQYQKDNGLKVDGIVGNQTLTTLKTEVAVINAPQYVKETAMASASKAQVGGIKDDAILMSTKTFDDTIKKVEQVKKDTGCVVKTDVKDNKVVITGIGEKITENKKTATAAAPQATQGASNSGTTWYDSVGAGFKEHFTNKVDAVKELVNSFQENPVETALSITIPMIITSTLNSITSNKVMINQSSAEGAEYGNNAREIILNGTSEEKYELLGDALAIGTEFAAMYGAGKVVGKVVSSSTNVVKGTVSSTKWVDKAGNIKWPPNNGAVQGTEKNVMLQKGYQFDRYGKNSGSYVSPVDTPYEMRSLAPGTENAPYKAFEVVKPVRGQGSIIESWFDQPGGGIQFKLDNSIENLLKSGRITEVTK